MLRNTFNLRNEITNILENPITQDRDSQELDLKRALTGGTIIAFDNKKLTSFKSVDVVDFTELENNLDQYPEKIHHYIRYNFKLNGFPHAAQTVLFSYHLNKETIFNKIITKDKCEFIQNADGSVTYIERFHLKVDKLMVENLQSGLYKIFPNTSNKDTSFICVATSNIRINNEEVEHTLDSTKIILMEEIITLDENNNPKKHNLFGNDFNHKDANLITRYNNTAQEVDEELDNDVNHIIACESLKKIATPNNTDSESDAEIKIAGKEVLYYAMLAKRENMVPANELPVLTKFLQDTAAVVSNTNPKNIHSLTKNIEESINGKYRRWGKLIGGAMLVLLGVIVLAVAATLLATSLGATTPLTPIMAWAATSIIAKGVAIGAAALLGIGGITFAAWGGSMFSAGNQENIATPANKLVTLAKKHQNK